MVGLIGESGPKTGFSVVRTVGQKVAAKVAKQPVDLNQISITVHHGCMRLPQEVVDNIMDMLQDDLLALKACSQACKSMFASTRHLVNQTLWLTPRNNEGVLTRGDQFRHLGRNRHKVELRFLSHMGERGLLQYTRQVQICMPHTFTPDTLLPHIHYFQSLDRVHTLTIKHYDPILWANHYSTCFVHFYPTLTSLTLTYPLRHYRLLLRFVAQFPNLENLCLEWMRNDERRQQRVVTVPARIDQFPPLRGHLRLSGAPVLRPGMLDLTVINELPKVVNFRSVQLDGFSAGHAQHILNACAHTLEDLTIMPLSPGYPEFADLGLTQNTVLRRFTLHMMFRNVPYFPLEELLRFISTITSPVFCEFVLQLAGADAYPCKELPELIHWGLWERIDRSLEDQFSERGDFRLVIRTGKLFDQQAFQDYTMKTFSLLASRKRIRFETSLAIG